MANQWMLIHGSWGGWFVKFGGAHKLPNLSPGPLFEKGNHDGRHLVKGIWIFFSGEVPSPRPPSIDFQNLGSCCSDFVSDHQTVWELWYQFLRFFADLLRDRADNENGCFA